MSRTPPPIAMACRQTLYARAVRAELIAKLGGFCVDCGEADPEKLEFDHIHGRDYLVHKLSYSARMARYKREAEQDLLALVCGDCNKKRRKRNDNGVCVPTNSDVPLTDNIPF